MAAPTLSNKSWGQICKRYAGAKWRFSTAMVGASGAGKSTLADLISGLLVPDQGEVLLDGQALVGERRPALLILDEATSALDHEHEQRR